MGRRKAARLSAGSGARWPGWAGKGLLWLASPLLLLMAWVLLVQTPLDVARGLAGAFSGHDVVQVADAMETGITLALVALVAGLSVLAVPRWRERGVMLLMYGALALVPVILVGGLGATYALQWVLGARGYTYCGRHVVTLDRGESGPSAYARDDVPGGCARVRAMFPPHTPVPGDTGSFDFRDRGSGDRGSGDRGSGERGPG